MVFGVGRAAESILILWTQLISAHTVKELHTLHDALCAEKSKCISLGFR